MSTTATSPETIVWAYTDRGDVPTRVIPGALAEILSEILRMRCVGTVVVEVDGVEVARGDRDDTTDLDDYLKALTD